MSEKPRFKSIHAQFLFLVISTGRAVGITQDKFLELFSEKNIRDTWHLTDEKPKERSISKAEQALYDPDDLDE